MLFPLLCGLFCFCFCFCYRANAASILDIVRTDPQLSTLASVIAGTGGGVPNPDIEDRFGTANSGGFTLFAPTNDAFARISKPVLAQLAIPQNYPLLLSLLRSHFVAGRHEQFHAGQNVTLLSVEGYNLSLTTTATTGAAAGANSSSTDINNGYFTAHLLPAGSTTATNGIIHKIDHLLDPYISIFGSTTTPNQPSTTLPTLIDPAPPHTNATMTDLILTDPALTTWTALITTVLSGILKRLSDQRGAENPSCAEPHPFAIIPSNRALARLPPAYTLALQAPFNFALASHLLAWGVTVPTCASFADILATVKKEGAFRVHSHRADLNLTVRETVRGSGELMVNNARVVVANRCAGNGCVWIVDRMLDPVFGMF